MAYQINNYNGTLFANIADGTLNTSSSLTLVGKNWSGYGQFENSSFLWIMQNFANSSSPTNPVIGQMWWNTTGNVMSVYTGNLWKPFASTTVAATTPSAATAVTGDLWWNTTAGTLNAFNGTAFVAVGPSVTNGTGAQSTVVTDTGNVTHSIVELIANNNVVGIISQDTFTPAPSIPGFTSVVPGLNLSGNIGGLGNAAGYYGSAVSVTGNITGQYLFGNGAYITGTIGNGSANVFANAGSFTGNVTAANFSTAGNVTAGNVVIGNINANGSYGTAGLVLTSAGPGANAYWAAAAANVTITNDVATASNLYPLYANVTSGVATAVFTSSPKYSFNPSTGALTANNMVSSSGIALNASTITQSYTIPAGFNGVSAGPITLGAGVVISVAAGSSWSVV